MGGNEERGCIEISKPTERRKKGTQNTSLADPNGPLSGTQHCISSVQRTQDEELVAVVPEVTTSTNKDSSENMDSDAMVPMVRIRLVTSLRVPAYQSVLAQIAVDPDSNCSGPLVRQYRSDVEETLGLRAEYALIESGGDSNSQVVLSNASGFTKHLEAGVFLGEATPATTHRKP